MSIRLKENFIMNNKVQRDVLPRRANLKRVEMCAPPSCKHLEKSEATSERMSLCVLKGSLTVEASLIVPFLLMIFLAFFSLLSHYASAAEMKISAAAEAKRVAVAVKDIEGASNGDITIYRSKRAGQFWINPFWKESYITQKAVCRAWIGFTELELQETYVYITPEGSVYHLYADCTHLDLSIQRVMIATARISKNEYGESYQKCQLCEEPFGGWVYITSEGNRYHSIRSCSGLKRTIRQVPLSKTGGRNGCLRCISREE